MKRAIKTENGLKTVMSVLAQEEASNAPLVAAIKVQLSKSDKQLEKQNEKQNDSTVGTLSSALMPVTTVRLQRILKSKK